VVCGELVLEEAMDLPHDRLRYELQRAVSVTTSPQLTMHVFREHDPMVLGDEFPTFRRIVTTLFAEDYGGVETEDEETRVLRNVFKCLQMYTESQPRRTGFPETSLRENDIPHTEKQAEYLLLY
jgi:hypothetical protein